MKHTLMMRAALALLAIATCVPLEAAELYVSPQGNDTNPGTKEKPLASLQGARDKVRSLLAGGRMTGDIFVLFRAGDYLMDAPVEFGPKDSGRDGYQVVYRNADGPGSARFVGGRKLVEKWSRGDDAIHTIDIGTNNVPHTLYSNLKITGMQSGKAVRSNRPENQRSSLWQNVSWLPGFDQSKLDLDAIGLKPDFPAEYGGQGAPTRLPELPAVGDVEFARYCFNGDYRGETALSTMSVPRPTPSATVMFMNSIVPTTDRCWG